MVQVLAVDVRHYSNCRQQVKEGAIAFVGLHHHQLALAQTRARAEGIQTPADYRRRIKTRLSQHDRDHRGCCGLPVSACYRDAELQAHEFGEHLRARDHWNLQPHRLRSFRVIYGDGRRHHDHLRPVHVACSMCLEYPRTEHLEPVRHRGDLDV